MDPATRMKIEEIADAIEGRARAIPLKNRRLVKLRMECFGLAWDLKQEARKGTPSQGI